MTSRQRGAALLLAALVIGRILDRFDLPPRGGAAPPRNEPAQSNDAKPGAAAAAMDTAIPSTDASRASQARPDSIPSSASAPADAALDALAINRAAAADLERLPGVGPVLAARIVAERDRGGRFRDIADLRRVRGIGAKTAARLGPRLRFD